MIQPDQIPQFTGDLAQLELDHAALKKDAGNIRTTGSDVHSKFQGLSAFYRAPEAEQLFATTKPVQEKADAFAGDLETVSSALSSYATEIRPLVSKLAELKTKAQTFVTSVKDDDEWEYDGDKVEEHNQIRDEITATVAAFWAAERTCHNKITAIWGGTQMVAGDGSERTDQYGFSAEDMQNAQLPWGDPVEEKHHWYEVGHWVKSFVWDGLIVDGIWGTIKGLGTLVGFGGWEAMGQAWKGLAQLATGLAITAIPGVGTAFWLLPDDKLPSWIRDSRTAMKETGKALVAWDEWGKNPGRAAGAVTFNVLTTVFTGGAGAGVAGAGKAGAVARVLGTAGKVIDPMTYVAKGAGAGLSKIGDISAALKGVGNIDIPAIPENAVRLPEGSAVLPDGTVRLPEGAAIPEGATRLPDGNVRLPESTPALPEGTVKLPTEDGAPARYYDPDGNILNEQGSVVHSADEAPGGVDRHGTTTSTASPEMTHVDSPLREPAMAGAHGQGGDGMVRGSGEAVPDHVGHTGDEVPAHQSEADGLPGGDHTPDSSDGRVGDPVAGPGDEVLHMGGDDAQLMGSRRDAEARVAPESTIAVPPEQLGDVILDSGDHVYFREGSTAIGYDRNTIANFDRVKPLDGYHDVVVHGNREGYFVPGRRNEAGVDFPAPNTHPSHIAEAIRNNPSYDGGPVRLISCHSGTVATDAAGRPLGIPAAQAVANELGVPVRAPTDKVGTDRFLGPGQEPTIFNNGYWRTFLPVL
ncbi:hypothetical protein [Streptomyces sp. NPDC018693]|uniref:hypothetical protein n=1 Tax=unclassified Streptomyces TaxID=2593676 RepID=UPI0037A7679C